MSIDGRTDVARNKSEQTLTNVNFKMQLDASSTSQAVSLIDIKVPYDGPLKSTGELKYDGQHIEINNFVCLSRMLPGW